MTDEDNQCGNEYVRQTQWDRDYDCTLPSGHAGTHEHLVTGIWWPREDQLEIW